MLLRELNSSVVTAVAALDTDSSDAGNRSVGTRNLDLLLLSVRREYILSPKVDIESLSP